MFAATLVSAGCPNPSEGAWSSRCLPFGNMSITGCQFANCGVIIGGLWGGAIYANASGSANITVIDCCFDNCMAWWGGAVCSRGILARCIGSGCSAANGAFAYCADWTAMSVVGTTLCSRTIEGGTITWGGGSDGVGDRINLTASYGNGTGYGHAIGLFCSPQIPMTYIVHAQIYNVPDADGAIFGGNFARWRRALFVNNSCALAMQSSEVVLHWGVFWQQNMTVMYINVSGTIKLVDCWLDAFSWSSLLTPALVRCVNNIGIDAVPIGIGQEVSGCPGLIADWGMPRSQTVKMIPSDVRRTVIQRTLPRMPLAETNFWRPTRGLSGSGMAKVMDTRLGPSAEAISKIRESSVVEVSKEPFGITAGVHGSGDLLWTKAGKETEVAELYTNVRKGTDTVASNPTITSPPTPIATFSPCPIPPTCEVPPPCPQPEPAEPVRTWEACAVCPQADAPPTCVPAPTVAKSKLWMIGLAVGLLLLIIAVITLCLILWRKKKEDEEESGDELVKARSPLDVGAAEPITQSNPCVTSEYVSATEEGGIGTDLGKSRGYGILLE